MTLNILWLFALTLTPLVARCQTPQQQVPAWQQNADGISFHADLPYLGESHSKAWYLYLVIAVIGVAFLMSLTVVIMGLVKWQRRKRILRKQALEAGDAEAYPRILHKGINVERGEHVMALQAPVMLDLVAYKPSMDEDMRLRALYKGQEEFLKRERMRRTAQHEKPLETLHTLRRLNSL